MEPDDKQPPTLLAWLGLRETPDLTKARPLGVFVGLILLLLFIVLCLGLVLTLYHFILAGLRLRPFAADTTGEGIRNIGLVLVALLGGPFLIWRSYVAAKQANTQVEALFNDKINAAATDLAARRQVTRVIGRGKEQRVLTEWEDDLVTRAAAIDRLEGLARERPDAAPRIARQLSIYVRELSREYPAKVPPENANIDDLRDWAGKLTPIRTDIEKAAQSLGRLQTIPDHGLAPGDISLRDANLQGFNLANCSFVGTVFKNCALDGTVFESANLHNGAFSGCHGIATKINHAIISGLQIFGQKERKCVDWNFSAPRYSTDATNRDTIFSDVHFQHCNFGGHLSPKTIQNCIFENCSFMFFSSGTLSHVVKTIFMGMLPNLRKNTTLIECGLRNIDFRFLNISPPHIENWRQHLEATFADGSVILPDDVPRPDFWPDKRLSDNEFHQQWKKWVNTRPR